MLLMRNPYGVLLRRLYDSPGAPKSARLHNSVLLRETMAKLPMKERVGYKKRDFSILLDTPVLLDTPH